jgi:diadenosine tetraphosphate (Ap4A) HIT family hydrolase
VTPSPPNSGNGCLACDLASGARPLPGGEIHRTENWIIEHTVGSLGLGTLIVKPLRHTVHVADLEDDEAREIGPILRQASRAVAALTEADQVYVCLWSHAERKPGHIHFVVQPVTRELMTQFDAHGPELQVAMFEADDLPNATDVEAFADRARAWFANEATA